MAARRQHGGGLVFLDLAAEAEADAEASASASGGGGSGAETPRPATLQVVVRVPELRGSGDDRPERHAETARLATAGSHVWVAGRPGRTRRGEPSLFAERLGLRQVQPDPSAVAKLLHATQRGLFSVAEAAACLKSSEAEVEELLEALDHSAEAVRPGATRVCRRLRGKPDGWSRKRRQQFSPRELGLVEAHGGVREAFPVRHIAAEAPGVFLGPCEPVLNVDGGDARRVRYIEERKRPQIQWMLARVRDMDARRARGGFRQIVDIGGGRRDLALAVAFTRPAAAVTVVDVNAGALAAGRQRCQAAGLANVRFLERSVEALDLAETLAELGAGPGAGGGGRARDDSGGEGRGAGDLLLLGLHACGGLSDAILQLAADRGCSFLLCTCCFASNAALRDVLAPGGWPGVSGGDGEALCRLAESADDRGVAERSMHSVNALRLRRLQTRGGYGGGVGLLAFNPAFSPRNLVLQGEAG